MDGPGQPPPGRTGARNMPHRGSLSEYNARLAAETFGAPPPPGIGINGVGIHGQGRNGAGSRLSRSPPTSAANAPSNKNTKHVPCKFFRQGACTAGDACPYSHADTPLEPCKFFLNGNCKYGSRCALPHMIGGRILNPQCLNPNGSSGRGSRHSNPQNVFGPAGAAQPPHPSFPFAQADATGMPIPNQPGMLRDFGSPPGSAYGSPGVEGRFGISPPLKGFSALDAPLPASYNSQDIPNIAKFGPNGSSVPVKSGWNPLTSSSPTTSMTGNIAFPNMNSLAAVEPREVGTSPPTTNNFPEPRRIILSGRQSHLTNSVSASLPVQPIDMDPLSGFKPGQPVVPRAEDDEGGKGEEFLPSSLSELLTDREKLRRFSRSEEDRPAGARASISSFGSPGSPSHASPSRFGAFFASQAKRDRADTANPAPSPFGHVGSPLRSSSTMANIKPRDFSSGSPSFGPISPPLTSERPQSISSLSEQLRELRMGGSGRGDTQELPTTSWKQPPSQTPIASALAASAAPAGTRESRGSMPNTNTREKVDEEPYLFSMEDLKDDGSGEGGKRDSSDTNEGRRFADIAGMAHSGTGSR